MECPIVPNTFLDGRDSQRRPLGKLCCNEFCSKAGVISGMSVRRMRMEPPAGIVLLRSLTQSRCALCLCDAAERCHCLSHRCFVHCRKDGSKPLFYRLAPLWMREHIEFILADRSHDSPSDIRRVEAGLYKIGDLGDQHTCRAGGVRRLLRAIALRSIAFTLHDAGANESGTEHAHSDAKRFKLH